ncbi:50S ribosomal protein L24 [Candidatus Jorgensenbacteria bacterium CG_4_10_14_0_8_um_filter_39_13]|uniref:Large ribosomal subunit protein uL24 n=2 Tax=Candidatus Joergenseniibacteriota TaxID=1752739 RepID=A0A2M7RH52_9BACT|nr:MAG: 50S ribosomal protein L24 [Candidatus Jorgensenbacteria bacterium CG11_big_fil_rev_8_21_14_0_20_38_23]PIV13197.1 MAG: 50S ribosomal protein L24 [Candidatus Jorgensenbacteria bacterium CG03_land_8_20_14_0_80_38_39]PIW97589.1 MAG: 50S ribosomal protein L24 [Candidatus Jorgensenbacteria bacterium CG_4_8_14_3_um_filter_38_10]PIY96034.1 MAG: 50S ribosomal protein L24 [Candidatus Jorgensenbacteria bacterium CG_4_10_14_0_8_um_filter_39_13]PJA94945.1 MAG: 50S ribosomal protein L24 [Candidatus J
MKIKKNDTVKILKGKDKNKSGKVIAVNPRNQRLTVEGLNLFKKHVRPRRQGEKGEVVQVARPLNVANAALICPACHQTTRIGFRWENGVKKRYCKKCQANV